MKKNYKHILSTVFIFFTITIIVIVFQINNNTFNGFASFDHILKDIFHVSSFNNSNDTLIGDVNGDGEVSPLDYIIIKNHIMGKTIILDERMLKSADVDDNGEITPLDYVIVKNIILEGPSQFKLNKNKLVLEPSESFQLHIYSGNTNLEWSSSNENVVTVNENGLINAIAAGSATITVKNSKGKSDSATVNVINIFDQRNNAIVDFYSTDERKAEKAYKNNKCNNYANRCDVPRKYDRFTSGNVKIYEYDSKTGLNTYVKTVDYSMLQYNLIPYKTYYLESEVDSNDNEYVKFTGSLRMINITKIRNIRDLGGVEADGGIVKYGKVFRGASPNKVEDKELSIEIFNQLGIDVIVDLRNKEKFQEAKKYYVTLEKYYYVLGYRLAKPGEAYGALKKIMTSVVDGKSVYFHCEIGTDRTGLVAYLVEALLGIPEEYRYDDYKLSYFYIYEGRVLSNKSEIVNTTNEMNKYDGNNDQEKAINWYLSQSDNVLEDMELINNFRSVMIDGNPTKYHTEDGKCVAD